MKYVITTIAVFLFSLISVSTSAVTYTYNSGWVGSTPSSPLLSGDEIIIAAGTFNQVGTFNLNAGSKVTIVSGATWRLNSTDILNNYSNDFTVNGRLDIRGSSTFNNYDSINISSTGLLFGTFYGELYNHSTGKIVVESGGRMKFTRYVDVVNDGTIEVYGEVVVRGQSTFDNNGTMIIDGALKLDNTAEFTNDGTLIVTGTVNIKKSSSIDNNGDVIGTGSIKTNNTSSFDNVDGSVNGCTGTGCIDPGTTNDIGATDGLAGTAAGTDYIYLTAYGFIPAGGPTSCDDRVLFMDDYTITSDFIVGTLSTRANLTVSNNASLTVCGDIINNGLVTISSNSTLVQISDVINSGTGSYIINQGNGYSGSTQFNIWSSPITNATLVNPSSGGSGIEVFPNTNPCDMYVFNASNQSWKYDFIEGVNYDCNGNPNAQFGPNHVYTDAATPDGIMDIARGYFAPGNGSATPKAFEGEINNGVYPIDIFSTNVAVAPGVVGNDWNLIGNPYPSGIDPSSFWSQNNGSLTNGLYFWDDANQEYDTWNTLGGTTPSGFQIAVAQGFYVLADDGVIPDGTSGVIEFNNSMRSTDAGNFYKTQNESQPHNVWVKVVTPSGMENKILVGFHEDATDGFDKLYDALKLSGNTQIRFASLLNNEEYVIQAIATIPMGTTKTVALSIFTAESGNHTFFEYQRENIPSGVNVYLKDNTTGTLHNLLDGNYSVNLDANETYTSRFELVFENVSYATSVKESVEQSNTDSSFEIKRIENVYTVSNTEGFKGTLRVYDVTGKIVIEQAIGLEVFDVQFNLSGFAQGVYVVHIVSNERPIFSGKIIR